MSNDSVHRAAKVPYRSDIDGLRAVAVLLVVFDHLKLRQFRGGFIGVDIFFVISGYLISATIIKEMNANEFSISSFYERRIRRILPALTAMLLLVSVAACFLLLPYELTQFAGSMLAALFSVSNVLFWQQTGYFDHASELKPFLHTWSLAVEEQFYIFLPILLLLIYRIYPKALRTLIWIAAIGSLIAAEFFLRTAPAGVFFLSPYRAWELLIGTILSQHYLPKIHGALGRNAASLFGLFLILVPALRYSGDTVFPGLHALLPCLGAACIIAAGETGPSAVGRLLSSKPVVFIGLISYSLYLWHWPLISFTNILDIDGRWSSRLGKLSLLAISILLATLSWRFVETPFRKGRLRPDRPMLFRMAIVAASLITAVGSILMIGNGFPQRFSPEVVELASYAQGASHSISWRVGACFVLPNHPWSDWKPDYCLHDEAGKKKVLLIGDSHSADLYFGLQSVYPELNISQATFGRCKMLLGPVEVPSFYVFDPNCPRITEWIYNDYLLHHSVDAVILSDQWLASDMDSLHATINYFKQHNIRVILSGPTPEFDTEVPHLLAESLQFRELDRLPRHTMPFVVGVDRTMAAFSREWQVEYLSPLADLCSILSSANPAPVNPVSCRLFAAPGEPVFLDRNHLTDAGSILYASTIRERHQLNF